MGRPACRQGPETNSECAFVGLGRSGLRRIATIDIRDHDRATAPFGRDCSRSNLPIAANRSQPGTPPPPSSRRHPRDAIPRVIPLAAAGRRQRPVAESDSTPAHPVSPRRVRPGPRPSAGPAAPTVERAGRQGRDQPDRGHQRARGRDQLVEGQSRIIQTRRELSRIVIANPPVADIELAQRPAGLAPLEYPGEDVRHDQLDPLGRDRPAGLVPGPGHDRHQGPGVADSSGVPRGRGQGPPGGTADHPGWASPRLQDDGGRPPGRLDDRH